MPDGRVDYRVEYGGRGGTHRVMTPVELLAGRHRKRHTGPGKHPVEMASDIVLSAAIGYGLVGVSLEGAFWFNFFAATGEYFYHANFKSPAWLRYFIQTPELHAVHHQLDVHRHNFSDLPLWDRLFGTYKDATEFVERCGFPRKNEEKIGAMLLFRDVYDEP